MATPPNGKYYQVNNPKALPRIFQREARRVSRPLIYKDDNGIQPQLKTLHEMTSGITALPPITGFVLTTRKDNPLVETPLVSPLPVGEDNNTLLAGWTYGLGKAVAFTSDAGARWTKTWPDQPAYDKLFGQIVRWSMRPGAGSGKFTTAFEVGDGEVRMVVNALDEKDALLNFRAMTGTAVGPDLKPVPMKIEQTAPGRYVGSFSTRDAGSYFVTVNPGGREAPIRTGVNVPYSDEFRDRRSNDVLLAELAAMVPKDGPAGQLIEGPGGADDIDSLLAFNTFRHDLPKATSSQDIWHLLALAAACLFFADVLVRRVNVNFAWVSPLARRAWDFVLRRQPLPVKPEYMERLRSRKAEVEDRIAQLRAATRFEMPEKAEIFPLPPGEGWGEGEPRSAVAEKPAPPALTPEQKEEEGYTERLLKAKKKAWENKAREDRDK
jgi:hypothetical protein